MTTMSHLADVCELVILDVGHGNAALVHEQATSLLIDAAIGSYVLEYLRQRAITTIDLVVLSHSDQDHIGGLIGILNAGIEVKNVQLNADSEKSTETWRDLIFSLQDAHNRGDCIFSVGLSSGQLTVDGFKRCRPEIVAPTPGLAALGAGANDRKGRKITSNSISACIRLSFDGRPVAILTGDMDEIELDDALNAKANLQAPLLVFPHHGGLPGTDDLSPFTLKLLEAVKPESIVFSIGRSKHDNPRPEIVGAIRKFNNKVHVVCTQLSMHCAKTIADGVGTGCSKVFSAGSQKNACCAGSVVFDLNTVDFSHGIKEAHINFVMKYVATPLCKG